MDGGGRKKYLSWEVRGGWLGVEIRIGNCLKRGEMMVVIFL